MTATAEISPSDLLERWDRQQEGYIRHRELRFEAMTRAVSYQCGPSPVILDLACGPGSLSARMRNHLPHSRVVAVDTDPVLVQLAREAFEHDSQVSVHLCDLTAPSWTEVLGGTRFNAVVSSTALHWLVPDALVRLYFELTHVLAPEGIFLNGDHFLYSSVDEARLRSAAAKDNENAQKHTFATAQTWDDWWGTVLSQERYHAAAAARERVWEGRGGPIPKVSRGLHLETLKSAGFREVGTVWQYFDDYVIAAFR